jgi:hypothetical protein
MENEYKDFNYFYVEKSLYYFGIESELSLACSKLFRAILYKFNSKYFPSALVISSRELSNLTGLEYCNIARVREKLLAYRYEKEPIVVYIKEPNQKYYYVLNKRLFTNLYKLIDRDVSEGMIPPGTENFLIDSAIEGNLHNEENNILDEENNLHSEDGILHKEAKILHIV